MEQHGENPRQIVIAIIPARYASTRLEGKLLLPLAGKPLILHTLEQASKAETISRVIVATDDERILRSVREAGHEAVLTSPEHCSGSDRIAEVAQKLPDRSMIVNVQGDEPLILPRTIDAAVECLLAHDAADMSTTCEIIRNKEDVLNPNVVKVVTDGRGYAVYFSRSPIPFPRDAVNKYGSVEAALNAGPELVSRFRKHTGLYVYRRNFLLRFAKMEQTALEKTEMLEQLRVIENAGRIVVAEVEGGSVGVDTQEDFERVKTILETQTAESAIQNV